MGAPEEIKSQIVEYNATESALASLRQSYKGVIFDLTTTKGMDAAKEARKELRTLRTTLEMKRKDLKAPILERGELIDAEAKRITAALRELEDPIDEQIKAEEKRKEAEREERDRIRRERALAIASKIDDIRRWPLDAVSKTSAEIAEMIRGAEMLSLETGFDEFQADAWQAKDRAIDEMKALMATKAEQEAEAQRLKEERAQQEAARKQVEAAAKAERDEAERIAAIERKRIADEQAKRDAEAKAERYRLDAERAEFERQRKAFAEQQEAAQKVEREKAEAEARATAEKARAEAAEAKAKADAEAAEKARREREDFERTGPGKAEILRVIAEHYGVTQEVAADWLAMYAA